MTSLRPLRQRRIENNHISHILRNDPKRVRVVDFARTLAAKRIQRHYRNYIDFKKERERIRFEQAKKRCLKNLARATIRKYVTLYLVEKRRKRETLEYHRVYNLDKIKHIQTKWRAIKACPDKLDVRRFKEVFYATLLGWKTRRILQYMRTIPSIKEAIDYISLRSDIKTSSPTDLFSIQIIERYPEMQNIFQTKLADLIENTVWIKKPKSITPTKTKLVPKPKKERSQASKIPPKVEKKVETPAPAEPTKRRAFAYSRKAPGEKQPHQRKPATANPKLTEGERTEVQKQTSEKQSTVAANLDKLKSKYKNQDPIQEQKKRVERPKAKQKLQKDDNLIPKIKPSNLMFNIKKTCSTPNHKDTMIAGFGRKTAGSGLNGNRYGFGEMKNMRKIQKEVVNESSEDEDNPQPLPKMESKPIINEDLKPKIDPLSMLRQSFNQRIIDPLQFKTQNPDPIKDDDHVERRDNIMNRKRKDIAELKLTSLSERKSMTRKIKGPSLQLPLQSFNLANNISACETDRSKNGNFDNKAPESDKYETLSLLTKLMYGLLERFDEDDSAQIE